LLCASSFGANYVYQGNGSDPNDWFDDANWSDGAGITSWPTTVDNALFTSGLGMTVSQAVPAFSQLQAGRGATNTVTLASGGVMTNLNQTIIGIVDNGEGHLVVDGGSLVTKALRLNVFGGASVLSQGSSVELKSGTILVDASFGGVNAGDIDLGLDESASLKISGGTLSVGNNLDFTDGLLEICGAEADIHIGNMLHLGTMTASETELSFVLNSTGGVSAITAGSFSMTGTAAISVSGTSSENAVTNRVLISLTSDTFSTSEFVALSNSLSLVNLSGNLSLNASSNQILFSGIPEKRPNVIIIYTDDHGFTDLGVHGIDSNVQTPELDSLAAGGALMLNGYSTAPQCVPSRAGIMSGRIQNTFGTRQNGDIWGPHPVPLDVPTIAERLVELGTYRTGIVGKWHLEPPPDTVAGEDYPGVKADYYPEARGFQEYFRNPVSPYVANFDLAGNSIAEQSVSDSRNRIVVQGEAAEAFIERNQDQPFFLYLALYGPHLPRMDKTDSYYLNFPELDYPHYNEEMDDIRRLGLGLVWAIDDAVGGVMQKLRDLGLEEDTLILFAGDNGAQPKFWDGVPGSSTLDMWTGNENVPLRGEKGSLWEGGVKVPMLAYWKNHIATNQVIDEPVWTLDFTATVLKLAGGTVPEEFDGVDILPRLTGETNAIVRTKALFWDWGEEISLRDGDWKIHRIGSRKSLFNLANDPYELYDLKYEEPEQFAAMETALMARYNALPADGQSRLLGDGDNWYVSGAPAEYSADPRFVIPYTNAAAAPYPAPLTILSDPYVDTDGDGMIDQQETALGRNPDSASDLAFEFNTDGDFEGWDGKILAGTEDYVTNEVVSGGMLAGENLDGNRGQFENYDFSFSGSDVSNLMIRVGSPTASGLVFRWATSAQNVFAQDRTLIMNYTAGTTNPVVIPVGVHTQWAGQVITRMRLNPANVPAPFAVDWIRASDGDYDGDGFSDSDEVIAGTDPVDAESVFRLYSAAGQFAWEGQAGRAYSVWYTQSLLPIDWNIISNISTLTSGQVFQIYFSSQTSGFYKVEAAY
jgi:arylsulfatase A-like enzyme